MHARASIQQINYTHLRVPVYLHCLYNMFAFIVYTHSFRVYLTAVYGTPPHLTVPRHPPRPHAFARSLMNCFLFIPPSHARACVAIESVRSARDSRCGGSPFSARGAAAVVRSGSRVNDRVRAPLDRSRVCSPRLPSSQRL